MRVQQSGAAPDARATRTRRQGTPGVLKRVHPTTLEEMSDSTMGQHE